MVIHIVDIKKIVGEGISIGRVRTGIITSYMGVYKKKALSSARDIRLVVTLRGVTATLGFSEATNYIVSSQLYLLGEG